VSTSDWISGVVALFALIVSALSLYFTVRWRNLDRRQANVSAYFHRNSEFAKVRLHDGTIAEVGYNIVLTNMGPAAARNVYFSFHTNQGEELILTDLAASESPIPLLLARASYPIPWLLSSPPHNASRLVVCQLVWEDDRGKNALRLQLRRGQV
jgi:hypothetical protein